MSLGRPMKNRLVLKLFLVLLVTVSVVVAMMMTLMRWSFERTFTDYINHLDESELVRVAGRLEAYYAQNSDWRALRQHPRIWIGITSEHDDGQLPSPPPAASGPERVSGGGQRSLGRPGALEIGPRLTLFGALRQPVIGHARTTDGLIVQPLRSAGRIVGWLGLQPLRRPGADRDVRFFERQQNAILAIGGITFLVATLASMLLARRLLVPVRALAAGARKLAEGEYETRVPVPGRDELGRLAHDFNRLAETLAATETARRRWLADISHELRTPLAILLGEIEAILDGLRPFDEKNLQSLHNEVTRLNTLVDDLYQLSLSDLGALDYHKEDVELGALVQQVVDGFRIRLAGAGLAIELKLADEPIELFADPVRLTQLLRNLLENSLRYTDGGGRVSVCCSSSEGQAFLDVQDSVPAVSDTALPRLFEHLFREEPSRNRAKGGGGLGLAIARNIVEAHQGRITAQASSLGGLWIHVVLPCASGEGEV